LKKKVKYLMLDMRVKRNQERYRALWDFTDLHLELVTVN
jgi:hypothetical protein